MKYIYISFLVLILTNSMAQDNSSSLPYQQIPDYPEDYGPGNVISRLIDGLGYRYYWATDSLREKDLNFKPSEDSRSTLETIMHIYGLSGTVKNASLNQPNTNQDWSKMKFDDFRKGTLQNLKEASELFLGKTEEDIAELKIVFQGNDGAGFPYWHMLNGPIADALYHTGQVVAFRRASGNPLNPNVRVFIGKNRD